MTTDHVHRNWTALAARMGYTSTRTQRARVVAATQRMRWSGYRAGESRRPLAGPAVRAVAVAILASAAAERGERRGADPLHNLIGIGIARLPGGRPLVGLDDGHARQYVLDLGNEAISVLTEPSHAAMSPDEHGPGEPRTARPILRLRPHHSPGSELPSYRSLQRVDRVVPRSALPASASPAVLQVDDLGLCDPDVLAVATVRSEQRARQLIADGMPEDDALAHAADDALDYARCLVADHIQPQDRPTALDAVVDKGAEPPGAA